METVTFKFDCQLNDEEDFIKENTVVQVVTNCKQYEGYIAVLITDGWSYNGEPIKFIPFIDHFTLGSFVELS